MKNIRKFSYILKSMYNRCENKLTIAGDSQIVDRFFVRE